MRLVGTTKPTIEAIRERTHWNSANLQPLDPVTLGLCSQTELDAAVQKAARRVAREAKEKGIEIPENTGTLLPSEETIDLGTETLPDLGSKPEPKETEISIESVFGEQPEADKS